VRIRVKRTLIFLIFAQNIRKSSCIIVNVLDAGENWMPPSSMKSTLAISSSFSICNGSNCNARDAYDKGSNNKYWDKNVCEAGYNETESLAAQNTLKSRGPFQIIVEVRHGLSFISLYFPGCGKVFRQGLKMLKN
jgi:hypothetical protein